MQYDNERGGVNCPAIFYIPPKAYISVRIGVSPDPETAKQVFHDAFGTQNADFTKSQTPLLKRDMRGREAHMSLLNLCREVSTLLTYSQNLFVTLMLSMTFYQFLLRQDCPSDDEERRGKHGDSEQKPENGF